LNQGTELNYAIGQQKELFWPDGPEKSFTSNLTFSVGFDVTVMNEINTLFGFSVSSSEGTTVELGYQSSLETTEKKSKTASCFLIRNQNQADLDGIDLYYDLLFSTLMFRRVPEMVGVAGLISGTDGLPVGLTAVSLISIASEKVYTTVTGPYGNYEFLGLKAGDYTLRVGDKQTDARVATGVTRVDIRQVRRALDLENSPVWEIKRSLDVSSKIVRLISRNLDGIFDEKDLAHITGHDEKRMKLIAANTIINWPRTALTKLENLSADEARRLSKAGLHSLQQVWREGRLPDGPSRLARATGIPAERIKSWIAQADASRVSIRRTGIASQEARKTRLSRKKRTGKRKKRTGKKE